MIQLAITAHAHGVAGIAQAIEAGFDSIEHCTFVTAHGAEPDPDVIANVARTGTVVSATLGRIEAHGSATPRRVALRAKLMSIFRTMNAAGVRIICSSDAGVSPSKPHNILAAAARDLTDIGVDNLYALRSVTSMAAEVCGVVTSKGQIAPGFDADIIAVQRDPTTDITALGRVTTVMKDGLLVRRR
jgi:imidazolonepropionase-like amidohydrolase